MSVFALATTSVLAASRDGFIQIKGSDTMVNLGQAWAEEFMMQHPEVGIAVTGGGSGTGIAALINGTCDIAQASRQMKAKELDMARERGYDVHEYVVGMDGLAVIVHPENPVTQLTIDQLSQIFTRRITNWKAVGGEDLPILVLSRERNSGTHVYFLEEVVRRGNAKGPEQFAAEVLMLPSSQAIAEEVAQGRAAIGYLGLGYVDQARHQALAVARTAGDAYVTPAVETVTQGTYPIARPLQMYLPQAPTDTIREFLDFIFSDAGQQIVLAMDFVPLARADRSSS